MKLKPCSAVPREGIEGFFVTLKEVSRAFRSRIDERLRRHGLSKAMWNVVGTLLCSGGPISQRELADALFVEGPSLVRLLDRLEGMGWVKRDAVPGDRRVKHVSLTDKAEPFLDELVQAAQSVEREIARGIPEGDVRLAHTVLLAMRDNLLAAG
ncbi:MarR family winged helix-turn-helix transcriptional regulator [Fundidesulfovibrio terrae]|uniref:MarR family winged helix-turn-helix transcriptional regulator n=1 Tax=Fundidesulfovibrio terrae TaxID=2922866 RepID=UPI001FAF5DF2|nr:MarR family transcriptional regulator [Fundidesulfovibrio terrae]